MVDTKGFSFEIFQDNSVYVRKRIVSIKNIQLKYKAQADFYIHNSSRKKVKIISVVPDCFCTTTITKNKFIAPNDSTLVKVVVSKTYPGIFQQIVTVETDFSTTPLLLVVRGKFIQ